jgi:hypothetical protein
MRSYPQISVRFPPELDGQVRGLARTERHSLNIMVLILVEEALKEREAKMAQPQR